MQAAHVTCFVFQALVVVKFMSITSNHFETLSLGKALHLSRVYVARGRSSGWGHIYPEFFGQAVFFCGSPLAGCQMV